MIAFLILLCLLLAGLLVVSVFYLWRFASIILILENDFSETTEVLRDAEKSIEDCLALPMFFDSPQVQQATMNALEGVKAAKLAVAKMVAKFTQRSKEKYIEVREVAGEEA